MDIFNKIWTDHPTNDQQTQQAKAKKAPPHPKRYKENNYRAQDITVDVMAELIKVEIHPSNSQ